MASFAVKEARINRTRKAEANTCGACGTEITESETLCIDCTTSFGGLSPFAHELNSSGTDCASDCPACRWITEMGIVPDKEVEPAIEQELRRL